MPPQLLEVHVEQSTGAMRESEEMLRARELLGLSLCNRSIIKLHLGDTYSGKVANSRTNLSVFGVDVGWMWFFILPLSPFNFIGIFLTFLLAIECPGSFFPYIYWFISVVIVRISKVALCSPHPKNKYLG